MANDEDVRIYGVNRAIDHPIKVSVAVSVIALLAFVWVFVRPALAEDLAAYFVTKSEMQQHTDQVTSQLDAMQNEQRGNKSALNGLRTQVNIASAFQLERGFKDDLNEHDESRPDPMTSRWRAEKREIEGKISLVSQYKDCVLSESKNCELLQRQLWQ